MNSDDHPALCALRHMNSSALVAEWTRLLGGPPPLTSCREFLLYTLAWHQQAEQHGGLSLATQRQLQAVMTEPPEGRVRRGGSVPRLPPGTELRKTWQGHTYTVTVGAKGYEFQGQTYASLSEIARLMTGTRWNGPAFFGLRKPPSQKSRRPQERDA
jgi:hypothetical protein